MKMQMNYIGSKYSLLSFITNTITNVVGGDLSDKVFCDIFAGTGIVGRTFKPMVKKVISNDLEYYSYVLNRNYLGISDDIPNKEDYIRQLNDIPLVDDGFIFQNYCLGSGSNRQYFSDNNGKRIDAARQQIQRWKNAGSITDDVYYFLLCSLLESADKVANTASVYAAFLKQLKRTADVDMIIKSAEFFADGKQHDVYCEDANNLISNISGDILYLDPPYNSRQYGCYYHILNTIAEYESFMPAGVTGQRQYLRSDYCSKRTVKKSFESLIQNANFKYIFLSYNNEGLMTMDEIRQILSKYGKYDVISQQYHRFRADKEENRKHKSDTTTEYIHILEK